MLQLTWNNWYRSQGCKFWMDVVSFAGVSFSSIFYEGMRLVFLNEQGKQGILYNGEVYKAAQQVIQSNNGKMYGFNQSDLEQYLKNGLFKFHDGTFQPRLMFEGPDKGDLGKPQYAKTQRNSSVIKVDFYNIVKHAREGTFAFSTIGPLPENATGAKILSFFCAGVVLHEIMHDHGFDHPDPTDWTPGSPYASSLPHVALRAVLEAAKKQMGIASMPIAVNQGNVVFWRDWECLEGQVHGDIGAVAVPGTNITDLYVRGLDNRLYQQYFANGGWSGWQLLDPNFELVSSPVVISASSMHRDVYVRGVNGNVLRKLWWNGVWHAWENLGGSITGDVGVVTVDDNKVTDLYARGPGNNLYQQYHANGKWSGWFELDNTLKLDSSPIVISANKNHRAVYARGKDGNVYHKYWDGNWRAWENLGMPSKGSKGWFAASDIAAVAIAGGITDLYVRGYDGKLWQKFYNGGWSDWIELEAKGFVFQSSPVVISAHSMHRDVYVTGWDRKVYRKYFV